MNDNEPEHEYVYFPEGDGVPYLIDLKEEPENLDLDLSRNLNTIAFHLFTRSVVYCLKLD